MVKKKVAFFAFLSFLAASPNQGLGSRPDILKVGLIKYAGSYDPYPGLWRELAGYLEAATGVETDSLFRYAIAADAQSLSQFGLVFLLGAKDFPGLSSDERRAITQWVSVGGGLLVIMDASPDNPSLFAAKIREEIKVLFGGAALEKIPSQHALSRSFYLMRGAAGVLARSRAFEGVKVGERYGVVVSDNDILGALVRDREGNYLFRCYPGGEDQRKESFKMAINIFLYALTGTYKSDVIHLPFIEEKLKK